MKFREDQLIQLLEGAADKKKIKRKPPPLVPLPYHLVPKHLVEALKINPPLIAHVNLKAARDDDKLSRKRSKMMERLYPAIEVFERDLDKAASSQGSGSQNQLNEEKNVKMVERNEPALFIGLPKNEDAVTKLLITKKEQLRLKQQRQVIFGPEGPLPDISEKSERSDGESVRTKETEDDRPLIDKLREELATNKAKQ